VHWVPQQVVQHQAPGRHQVDANTAAENTPTHFQDSRQSVHGGVADFYTILKPAALNAICCTCVPVLEQLQV
jgi:hypothetical protein